MGAFRGRRAVARCGLVVLALLAVSASGCGGDEAPDRAPDERAQLLKTGARVFEENCQTCHPLLGRPNTRVHTDYVPGLDLDQVSPSRAYAARMVETGGVAMGGAGPELSRAEQRAVVEYVLEVGGRESIVPQGTSAAELAEGRQIYDEHCQRCHAIDGREATRHNPIWHGTDFDELRPGVLHVERFVREGLLQGMPSFRDRLTPEQIRAVALYVNATARGGPPPDAP